MKHHTFFLCILFLLGVTPVVAIPAVAEEKYAPGVTDTEIKVGQTMPYSGPASAWATVGLAELAYIKMINAPAWHRRAQNQLDQPGRWLQSV